MDSSSFFSIIKLIRKSQKSSLFLGVVFLICAIVVFTGKDDIARLLNVDYYKYYTSRVFISGVIFLLIGLSFLSFYYLQTDINAETRNYERVENERVLLKDRLMELERQLHSQQILYTETQKLLKKTSTKERDDQAVAAFKNSAVSDTNIILDSSLKNDLEFKNLNDRIFNEIGRLRKSANYNLTIGGGITIAAITYLGYEVYAMHANFKLLVDILSYYIPRLTIIIFIEVFAFFFLKIYKSSLADIKYFHNELTNIELKAIALRKSIDTKNESIISTTITDLSKTERNFILKKGESTIDLEKDKIEGSNSSHLIDLFKDFLKTKGVK